VKKRWKKVTIYLRLVGLVFIFIGVILNFQMYIYEEWPTYLFLVSFGVLLIGLSYLKKPKS
jgi:uncharacterized membrane protein YesL